MEILSVRAVPAGKRQVRELGRLMRPADRAEILASGGWSDVERCLRANVNRSVEAWAMYADKDLLCIVGVLLGPNCQVPWVLTSVHVDNHPLTFWRASKEVVDKLRDKYPLMINMIHAKYGAALRWAERLGFTIMAPEKFGVAGDLFCKVVLDTRKIEVACG